MDRVDSKQKARADEEKPLSEPLICERWMTMQVHKVKPQESVAHARALLEEHRINQLLVVKNNVLVGIVTDRDLRDAVSAVITSAKLAATVEPPPQTPDEIPVEAVMSHHVIALAPHSSLVNAASLMRQERIGSVPIVDVGNRVTGIVTRSDVLDAFVWRESDRRERLEPAATMKEKSRNTERRR